MYLRPSEIFFSQDEINNFFDKKSVHRGVNLGRTLDDLVEGRCKVSNIPTISVMRNGSKWITADNRRLWVFRHLEKLGKCETIPVSQVYHIDCRKLNSTNGGRTVCFYRGRYAEGIWHAKVSSIAPEAPCVQSRPNSSTSYSSINNFNIYGPTQFGTQSSFFYNSPRSTPSFENSSTTMLYSRINSSNNRIQPSRLSSLTNDIRHLPERNNTYVPTSRLTSALGTLSLSNANNTLDPSEIRYTKESIQIGSAIVSLKSLLMLDKSLGDTVDAITVYKAFRKYWAVDGNKRLWAFKEARKFVRNIRIPLVVKEEKDEFLDFMRKDRPWLSSMDIIQSGKQIDVCP